MSSSVPPSELLGVDASLAGGEGLRVELGEGGQREAEAELGGGEAHIAQQGVDTKNILVFGVKAEYGRK